MFCLRGEFDQAVDEAREALNLDLIKRMEMLRGYILLFYCMALLLKDEQDALLPLMDELTGIGEKNDYKYMLGYSMRLAAFTSYRDHDLENALERLDASTRYFEGIGNNSLVSTNELTCCLWLCGQDSPAELLAAGKKALKALTSIPSGMCLQEIGLSILGAVARESGDYILAKKSLTAAIKRSKTKHAKQVLSGSCLHLAKLYYDTGDKDKGEDYLRQAFDLAANNKYAMFWDMHFPTLVEMAARCVRNQIHSEYAKALIARYFGSEAAEFLHMNAKHPADNQMKEFTDDFISRFGIGDESQAPKISVTLLGRFSISVNGIKIEDREWKTKKIAGILKSLMLNRGRPVSRDRLMEVFWPEADKKLALMSLRAALYELKKVLRKYCIAAEGNASLLKETRDSLAVRTGSLLAVDLDLFLAHADELKTLPLNRNGRAQKKTILERMVALYRGDLLEEDIYEDWTFAEREELRSIYLESIIELADIYVMDGDNRKAEKLLLRTLAIDRYNEEACLSLLKLYIGTNQRSRAAKLSSDFVHRFEKELGIKPDDRLISILQSSLRPL